MRLRDFARPAAAASALVFLMALTPDGEIEPTLRTEANWFHCAGDTKVQNLNANEGNLPSWDTDEPAGSFTSGEGCGYYENLLSGNDLVDATWSGSFAGNLDSFTVEVHRLIPQAGVTFPNRFVLTIAVDGSVLYDDDINLSFVESSTGASESALFSVTGLDYLEEDGDGTIERSVTITLASYNETQSIWVFDATEIPAGITFNPEIPKGARVQF